MDDFDTLAGKIFSLLKGNGLQIKIFNSDGAETTDPNTGRRFFVSNPNIMVTIDEDSNRIEFSKGTAAGNDTLSIQKNIRKLADEFQMNSDIKVFGKAIQPRDYSYQAKMKKGEAMMENTNTFFVGQDVNVILYGKRYSAKITKMPHPVTGNWYVRMMVGKKIVNTVASPSEMVPVEDKIVKEESAIKPHNHHLLGEVLRKIKHFGSATAAYIADNLSHPVDLSELQPVLNRLVQTGKIVADQSHNGDMEYKMAVDEAVMESFSKMFGSMKTSQQTLENVKILVKHKIPVDENVRGSRSRHISAIFLECNGERFRFPNTYLPGARAMAQHLAHGGLMGDKVGSYISESTNNLLKLQSFNRYVTTNKLINEDSSGIVETVKENIETIRTELKKLTGVKTYETVKARLETFEREALAEDDTSTLKDLFTIRRFDEKFEGVLPIIKQLVQEKDTYHKRIEEAAAMTVTLHRSTINTTPIFEFASANARLGFKLSEFSLRMVENDELASFVNKIGTKLCKEGVVNDFERAVLTQVLENAALESFHVARKDIKESADLSAFFDKYDMNFF